MNRAQQTPWWAEPPLVAVSAAVAVGFIRVYEGWSFLVPLLAFAVGAHLVAIAARRLGAPAWLVLALAVAGAPIAVGIILFPETTALGLPTSATWNAAHEALLEARELYPVVVAPTEVLPGFQLVSGLALWVAAWLADWTGQRLRATAEAMAPGTAIFVFCAILGSGEYRIACAALFGASVLVFIGVQRSASVEREQAWLPTGRITARSVLRGAGAVAAVVVVAGVVIGPRLPGADADPAFTWRDKGTSDKSRVTVSPMVELKKRLVDQSDTEVFRVKANDRAYWRLTSLDTFDGEIWSSSGEFKQADDDLASDAPEDANADTLTQEITIEGLSTIWAPSAFEATSVTESEADLRWDRDSSTLIVDSSRATSDGLEYTVISRVPTIEQRDLRGSWTDDPSDITDRYLGLPDDFPSEASDAAETATDGAENRYEEALALQDFFRDTFTYSLDSPAGHGDDALVTFLESGEGYCEQFAGAYAAMARSLGMPARVAVGFTPGIEDPDEPGVFQVLGRHAHAWPEVYFPGTGWVAFEPTPGRGMPGAESYTGVPEQQDEEVGGPTTTTTTAAATTTTPASPTTTGVSTSETRPRVTAVPDPDTSTTGNPAPASEADDGPFWTSPAAAGALVLVGLAAAALVIVRRRRRGARLHAQASEADRAWARAVRVLTKHRGLVPQPSETHLEFAERARPELADLDGLGPELRQLAELVTESRWSDRPATPDAIATAEAIAERFEAEVTARVPVG